jgi:hypothetical protein
MREAPPMRNEAIFMGYTQESPIKKTDMQAFIRLYQQSVLMILEEQGLLSHAQVQETLSILDRYA